MKKMISILSAVFIAAALINFIGVSYFKQANISSFKNYSTFYEKNMEKFDTLLNDEKISEETKNEIKELTGMYKAFKSNGMKNSKEMGMNAIILQVRPSGDALYQSSLFPWSKYLTGTAGTAPAGGFDPLAYWVEQAHALGLEIHAWINPFRLTKGGDAELAALPADSVAKKNPQWVVGYEGQYYLNPGLPQVREYIIQGAEEIARNYDVDGIHMDDYFYPGAQFDDAEAFAQQGGSFTDIADWRRDNVNLLVKEMGQRVHAIKDDISYGISPAGVWANKSSLAEGSDTKGNQTYFSGYADSRKWVKEGWVDYIAPQIYWYIGHKSADYKTLALWWAQCVEGTGVKLYIGMADYQACNESATSPWYGTTALEQQLQLNDTIAQVAGEMHFRYATMVQKEPIKSLYKNLYNKGDQTQPPVTPAPEPEKPALEKPLLNTAQHMAYIQGSEGKFRPEAQLSRAEAVTMLARLSVDGKGKGLYGQQAFPAGFADVSSSLWYAPYVGFARAYGISGGYEDGSFQPDRAVTRAELMQLIAAFYTVPTGQKPAFTDVPASHWAASAIAYGAQQGWVGGYEDGTFRPNQPVTRAEAVRMLNGALDRNPDANLIDQVVTKSPFADLKPGHWAYYQVLEAATEHSAGHEAL